MSVRTGCSCNFASRRPLFPDGVFVEDAALVLDEVAIITRPEQSRGAAKPAASREVLAPFRELRYIPEPATLEGGDVVHVGKTLYVGVSGRTNREGISQLTEHLKYLDIG